MSTLHSRYINALVCPSCHKGLKKSPIKWQCENCDKSYPVIDNTIPVLFIKPAQTMFKAALSLADSKKKFQARKEKARQMLEQGIRPRVFMPVFQADKKNIELIDKLQNKLLKAGVNETLMEKIDAVPSNKYDFHYGYLIRDWSYVTQFESQFQHQLNALLKIFKQYPLTGRVLIPGAASARLPLEICAQFKDCEIHALEASYSSVMLYYHLLKQDYTIYALGFKNVVTPEAVVNKFVIKMPEHLRQIKNSLHYQWADYCALPYNTDSMDWIVSVYFTDVLPFDVMIKQTSRVLKKGGYFLHYGPLTWHSKLLEQCYTLQELKELFSANGFKLIHEDSAAYLDKYREHIFDDEHLSFDLGYVNFKNSILLLQKT